MTKTQEKKLVADAIAKGTKAAKPVSASKRVTKALLEQYTELRDSIKALEAAARAKAKEMDTLKAALMEFANEHDNDVETCGYRVRVIEGARYPAWKAAYASALGDEAAEAVLAATEPSFKLEVTPA